MVKVEYSSNNSGGSWWLTYENWKALELAGWKVNWVKNDSFLSSNFKLDDDRWFGALARSAEIEVDSPEQAIQSFEAVTGETANERGCECCGPPHSFSWLDENNQLHFWD